MDGKFVLVALVVAYSQNLAQSHILPSRHDDSPLGECVRSLTRHMLNLCATYEDYSSELFDNDMTVIHHEFARRRPVRDRFIRACCSRPCSASELLAIC